jgi:hypothetical protein
MPNSAFERVLWQSGVSGTLTWRGSRPAAKQDEQGGERECKEDRGEDRGEQLEDLTAADKAVGLEPLELKKGGELFLGGNELEGIFAEFEDHPWLGELTKGGGEFSTLLSGGFSETVTGPDRIRFPCPKPVSVLLVGEGHDAFEES